MPHLHLSEEELAFRHPSILAPPEEPLPDVQCDDDDAVFVHGCKFAESIQFEVDKHGRRRHCAIIPAAGPAARQTAARSTTTAIPFLRAHSAGQVRRAAAKANRIFECDYVLPGRSQEERKREAS